MIGFYYTRITDYVFRGYRMPVIRLINQRNQVFITKAFGQIVSDFILVCAYSVERFSFIQLDPLNLFSKRFGVL